MISMFPTSYILVQYIVLGNERIVKRQMDRMEWRLFSHLIRKRRWEHKLDYQEWMEWVGKNL